MTSIPADVVVAPIASEDDAAETCSALAERLGPGGRVVLLYVVEKAGGAPDKASVEQREAYAEDLFSAGREQLAGADRTVDTRIGYDTDVADGIYEVAREEDADLIAFSPREASRITRLLSGDTTLDLVTDAPIPVLVLPTSEAEA